MNKAIKLFTTLGLTISCVAILGSNLKEANASPARAYIVDFFNNYLRQDFELSNGFKARGNNVLYKSVTVGENLTVEKTTDPTRKNYEFKGWYKETDCLNEWNFTTDVVVQNTRLYAKWEFDQEEVVPEPSYTPPSTVLPDSAEQDYVINSVMYSPVKSGSVKVTKAALLKLDANKTNVLPLMEYKVKNGKTFTATYAANVITVTCNGVSSTINVQDDSANHIIDNSTYEQKAKNYEANATQEDSYHVMLAGSSSIEFWTSSATDLDPIVSYNHGIGGTTIEQWDKDLNQRLVYPYKPKMVVYYVGINNVINTSQDDTTIWNNLKNFFDHTHEALPDTKVQYIMMNLIPGYPKRFDTIKNINKKVEEYQKTNPWLTLINPGEKLLKENGEPNAAYFRTDGLHLSLYGYVVWGAVVKESILAGLQAN